MIMDAKSLVRGAMAAVKQRTRCDVALYVDEEMLHVGADGVERFLPVIAVEGGGYDPIPEHLRDEVSTLFGALLPIAEIRVEEINLAFGLEPDDAMAVVECSFAARRA